MKVVKKIKLNNVQEVAEFCQIAEEFSFAIYVQPENKQYKLNAKSILSLFTLNLKHHLIVLVDDSNKLVDKFIDKISKYVVEWSF